MDTGKELKQWITIEIPANDGVTLEMMEEFCHRHHCIVAKERGRKSVFLISSEDPVNFFWLGMNLQSKLPIFKAADQGVKFDDRWDVPIHPAIPFIGINPFKL